MDSRVPGTPGDAARMAVGPSFRACLVNWQQADVTVYPAVPTMKVVQGTIPTALDMMRRVQSHGMKRTGFRQDEIRHETLGIDFITLVDEGDRVVRLTKLG